MALLSMRKTLVESSFFARIDSLSSESIRSFKVAMLLLSVAGGALFSAARSVDFTQLLHRALFRRQRLLLPLYRRLLIMLPLADLREDPRFFGRLFEPLERAFDGLAFLHANPRHLLISLPCDDAAGKQRISPSGRQNSRRRTVDATQAR